MSNKTWETIGLISLFTIIIVFPAQWIKYRVQQDGVSFVAARPYFVGGESCIECHKPEYDRWLGSDHDLAMDSVWEGSVLGDFNDAVFISGRGDTSKFYTMDGRYFVYTHGVDGVFSEHEIKYTFGWWPLQQYLVPMEGGRLQVLHLTWDSRDGRWYDMSEAVYAGENVTPENWLYWTNQAQNWNGMCADCHSTNLRKNYDHVNDMYRTSWSDIDVNCESCHGPSSAHLEWAAIPEMSRPDNINTGLVVDTRLMGAREYADHCARCHLRRAVLGDHDHFGRDLLDHYIPQLTGSPYYFPDGQILEEDYVYGSFLQSRMFMNDVKCNDCHDAHSLELVKTGNELCLQCHRREVYDNYNHHFHKMADRPELQEGNHRQMVYLEGEGALCINCHMDGRYYMGVDYRRDHSFRIPRPDLSISLGVPNACNSCHKDESARWSEQYITEWYGRSRDAHYGVLIAGGENADTAALAGLIALAGASVDQYPVMVRATALSLLDNYDDESTVNAMKLHLANEDPIIRHFAVRSFHAPDVEDYKSSLVPMLSDPVKAVRIEAAYGLSMLPAAMHDSSWVKVYQEALHEYEQAMIYTADFASGSYNLANLYSRKGDVKQAESWFLKAISIDDEFFPAKINLAMLYNMQQENDKAEALFREVLAQDPEQPEVYYSLGLLLAEMQRYTEAAKMLEKAGELMPERSRIFYNLGLLYDYLGKREKALFNLKKAMALDPANREYDAALTSVTGRQE